MNDVLTDEQKAEYSAENTYCPFCGSNDVSQRGIDNEDGVIVCDVECDECEETWQEIYTFSSVCAYR